MLYEVITGDADGVGVLLQAFLDPVEVDAAAGQLFSYNFV